MRLSILPFLLLVVPLAEIATFVVVGGRIGVLPTIGLVVLTAVVGATLLRIQGFGIVSRIRTEMEAGRAPGRDMANGVMVMIAGVLLLTPGFLTDTLGLLLFIPPVRDRVWRFVSRRISVVAAGAGMGPFARGGSGRGDRGTTIDLGPEDFSTGEPPGPPKADGSHPDANGPAPSPWRKPGEG